MSLFKSLVSLLFLLIILAGAALVGGYYWVEREATKPGPLQSETIFTVKPGEGLSGVATRLAAEGFIADDRVMKIRARIKPPEGQIKVGEYAIPAGASVDEIMAQLVEGKVVMLKLTIPEGLTTKQVLALVAGADVLAGDMPDSETPEGVLQPDTYLFPRGETRAAFIQRMQEAQAETLDELWQTRNEGLPLASKEEALILASIVQKEAAGHEEYGNVASVFINRLNKGMKLQTDPTVHYGVNGGEPLFNRRGQRRTLYRSELDRDTPWNTYTREGLPATAIANPGRHAIEAVLNPPQTDYLFFVADGKGGTTFTTNVRDHERAVAAYRKYEREEIARERAND